MLTTLKGNDKIEKTSRGSIRAMREAYAPQNITCRIKDIDFVRVSREKGVQIDFPEGKESNGFRFIRSGSMLYRIDGIEYTVRAGEAFFIPKGVPFFAEYLEDGTNISLAQFDILEGSLPEPLLKAGPLLMRHSAAYLDEIFERRSFGVSELSRAYHGLFRIYELIWDAVDGVRKSSPKFTKLAPALKEMQRDFAGNRKIEYYADMCGMSETGFRRLFVEYTGVSPIEYRNRVRLTEARDLIGTGEYLVEEVAALVGFSNVSFFCRSFKRLFGRTPMGK